MKGLSSSSPLNRAAALLGLALAMSLGRIALATENVRVVGFDCGPVTHGKAPKGRTFRPKVHVHRFHAESNSHVNVRVMLSENGMEIGRFLAGVRDAQDQVPQAKVEVPPGATVLFEIPTVMPTVPPTLEPYHPAFGDALLHGVGPDNPRFGGPPLVPSSPFDPDGGFEPPQIYGFRVEIYDYDSIDTPYVNSFHFCRTNQTSPKVACQRRLHVTFAVYGTMYPSKLEQTNGCWTWDRPGSYPMWQERWADCDTHPVAQTPLKGAKGTGQWVYNETRTGQPAEDASFIPQCAARATATSDRPLQTSDTLAYVYMAPPLDGAADQQTWLLGGTRAVIEQNSRYRRYFPEVYRSKHFGHPLLPNWCAKKEGAPMTKITCKDSGNCVGLGHWPPTPVDVKDEIRRFCCSLPDINGPGEADGLAIYAGSAVTDKTAASIAEALNSCTAGDCGDVGPACP